MVKKLYDGRFVPYRKDPNYKPPTTKEKILGAKDAAEKVLELISRLEQLDPKMSARFAAVEKQVKAIQWEMLDALMEEHKKERLVK